MPGSSVEGGLHRGVRSLPSIKPERLKTARARVEKAVRMQRVFSVQGPYPVIRAALWSRGWVERRLLHPDQKAPCCYGDGRQDGDDGDAGLSATETVDEGEKEENHDLYDLISHLVRNERTYFYWTTRRDYIDCRSLRNDQMTNHFGNTGTFATKVGLCMNLRNLHWFDTADPNTFFPRCYRVGAEDEKHAFIEDFQRTACSSLLQHVVQTSQRRDGAQVEKQQAVNTPSEDVTCVGPGVIATALHVCQDFLNVLAHCDIDVETPPAVGKQQWTEFLQDYYKVVHEGASIKGSGVFVERCQDMLLSLQDVCPQLDTDGVNNIWIIKPGAMSRGRGIMCMNRLDEILALVDTDRAFAKESKWVVQKYLERPLLVNGTKFDLRQWFLVTDWNPLTVWFYSECYLRFSTQPYSTTTLDSSVHLCNNSIQKRFQPSHDRHPGVPKDSMWSCSQFRAFLEQQGRGAEWDSVVVPGMRRAVVHALQTAQELVEPRRASFELYGADFMLGSNLRPWLLEINVSPTMACSTAVTARLCPAVQLDTLRVVLDRRNNPSAYTGGFQLIYKQRAVQVPQCVRVSLLVEGSQIRRPRLCLQKQKENQAVRGKKKQLRNLSASPQREREGRRRVGRSCVSLEPSTGLHPDPQRKAKCLALGGDRATLVPRSLCFSFTPLQNISDSKAENKPGRRSHSSRSFLHHAAPEAQHRTSTELSRLQCQVPAPEVFSLQPNSASPDSSFASRSRFQRQQFLPRSYRPILNRCKREHVNRSKICAQ